MTSGIRKAEVIGHDIGQMIANAYAAQFPSEVEKLVVMDASFPGSLRVGLMVPVFALAAMIILNQLEPKAYPVFKIS